MLKKYFFWIVIIFLLFVTRFWVGNRITPSLTHDEMIYAANAFSLSQFGKTLSGNLGWFSLKPVHHMYAEWTASLMAPFFWIIKDPIIATHALSGLLSFTFPFVFGWLLYGIFADKKITIITIILLTISPLVIQFSKLSYDSFIALYFYILGGAVYLNSKSRWRILAYLFLVVGFFNYQGLKLVFLPWTVFLYFISNIKKSWLLPIFGLCLTLAYGIFLLPNNQTASRLDQTILTDISKIDAITQSRRAISLLPKAGTYFSNSILSRIELGFDNLWGSIDPRMLFLRGEPASSGFAVYSHGFFYPIDFLIMLIGLTVLFQNKKTAKKGYWLCAILACSLMPAILSTASSWFLLRSLFFYLLLYVFISFGIKEVWLSKIGKVFIVLTYTASFAIFSYQYFFQYPVARADAGEFHERLVVEYAERIPKNVRVIVYDDEPSYLYMSHLVYQKMFQNFMTADDISLGNVLYTNICQEEKANDDVVITSAIFDPCQEKKRAEDAVIVSLLDSGKKYSITNDYLCKSSPIGTYIRLSSLNDFEGLVEDTQKFCQRFIVNQTL